MLLQDGHRLVSFQPDTGNILMVYEILAQTYLRVARENRLSHIHVNNQPLGNYDRDLRDV